MSKPARRLGRGLDSLVSDLRTEGRMATMPPAEGGDGVASGPEIGRKQSASGGEVHTLPVEALRPNPHQPRTEFNDSELESLASSIRRSGLLQPIAVRYHGGSYQIIAGERRWRAAQLVGITNVPVVVRIATDEEMLELALIENLQREDLNPIDRAQAYRTFRERFGLSAEEVAERLGEDRSTVANYLRLLELPKVVQDLVAAGELGMGHARSLLGVGNEGRRIDLAAAAVRGGLSVRALEEIVRRAKVKGGEDVEGKSVPKGKLRSANLRDMERRFEEATRTKVTIREGKRKGSGRIVIEYFSLDDFDRIAEMLGVEAER
jgi:ParB family transcriptional regulator, chromosome partitioning protein